MSKTVTLSKAQMTTILSCINERESLYLQEIKSKTDDPSEVLMVKGYKKHLDTIKEIKDLLGFKR